LHFNQSRLSVVENASHSSFVESPLKRRPVSRCGRPVCFPIPDSPRGSTGEATHIPRDLRLRVSASAVPRHPFSSPEKPSLAIAVTDPVYDSPHKSPLFRIHCPNKPNIGIISEKENDHASGNSAGDFNDRSIEGLDTSFSLGEKTRV
jgi:hypothetical protein